MKINLLENYPIADPKQFKEEARGAEKYFCDKSSETLVVQLNDNSVVCIASNQQGMLTFNKVDRYSAAVEKKVSVPMSSLIKDYKRNMRGVDQVDENIGNYSKRFVATSGIFH